MPVRVGSSIRRLTLYDRGTDLFCKGSCAREIAPDELDTSKFLKQKKDVQEKFDETSASVQLENQRDLVQQLLDKKINKKEFEQILNDIDDDVLDIPVVYNDGVGKADFVQLTRRANASGFRFNNRLGISNQNRFGVQQKSSSKTFI